MNPPKYNYQHNIRNKVKYVYIEDKYDQTTKEVYQTAFLTDELLLPNSGYDIKLASDMEQYGPFVFLKITRKGENSCHDNRSLMGDKNNNIGLAVDCENNNLESRICEILEKCSINSEAEIKKNHTDHILVNDPSLDATIEENNSESSIKEKPGDKTNLETTVQKIPVTDPKESLDSNSCHVQEEEKIDLNPSNNESLVEIGKLIKKYLKPSTNFFRGRDETECDMRIWKVPGNESNESSSDDENLYEVGDSDDKNQMSDDHNNADQESSDDNNNADSMYCKSVRYDRFLVSIETFSPTKINMEEEIVDGSSMRSSSDNHDE